MVKPSTRVNYRCIVCADSAQRYYHSSQSSRDTHSSAITRIRRLNRKHTVALRSGVTKPVTPTPRQNCNYPARIRLATHRGSSQLSKTRTRLTTPSPPPQGTEGEHSCAFRESRQQQHDAHQPCHARRVSNFHLATPLLYRLPPQPQQT